MARVIARGKRRSSASTLKQSAARQDGRPLDIKGAERTEAVADDLATLDAALDEHVADTDNPHEVTAAQVGADPTGTATTAVSTHAADEDAHKGQKNSIEVDAGDLQLVGDADAPGANQVYGTDADGAKGWKADPAGGSGSPGGSDTQLQFNDGSAFGGDSALTWNKTTDTLSVDGAAVFNESGADKDFRIEGDTEANLVFVDASADRVGIGTSSPGARLDVAHDDGVTAVLHSLARLLRTSTEGMQLGYIGDGSSGIARAHIRALGASAGLSFGTQTVQQALVINNDGTILLGASAALTSGTSVAVGGNLSMSASGQIHFGNANTAISFTAGVGLEIKCGNPISLKAGSTGASMIGVGGFAATDPGFRKNGTTLETRLADNSAYTRHAALHFQTMTALITATDGADMPTLAADMIGATGGPATAAQHGWLEMKDSAGASCWVPVWK